MKNSLFFLLLSSAAYGQLVLPICTAQLPCPGFPLGSVQAPIDANGWRNFKLALTQNVTQFSFVGTPPPAQASATVIFTQDATGGRTVTFASNITNACTVTATANATTLCQFEFDGIAGIWIGISASGGVATGVWTTLSPLAPGVDNSTAINTAISAVSSAGGGTVALNPGSYTVLNPINALPFVTLRGAGPPGGSVILAGSTMSPQLNVIQAGYNSSTCVQAFGTVTVTGTLPGVLTLPVMGSLGSGGAVSATSTTSGGNVIATFTAAAFGGATGILPIAQQSITGTGFTVAGYNSDWTVITANATTITAYQAGGASFAAGSTGTLSLTFRFPAAGVWNNQYVFVNGTQYQVTSSTSSSLTLATYNGTTGINQTFQGVYSGCPVGFSLEKLTIDANCGTSNAAGTPCQSGGRGTGAGHAVACRGCYRSIFRDLVILHSPNDALYTEGGLFVNNVIPVYSGVTSGTFGLATTVFGENIRFAEANNNGVEHLGPADGMWINLVGSFTGGVGYKAACVPGSFGVCGNDTFLFGPHMFKTGNWDYQFLAEQYVTAAEAESPAVNGAYDVGMQIDSTQSSAGVLANTSGLAADNITGDCLFISSPPASFASNFAVGNTITNVNCSGVTGYGIHVPVSADTGTAMGKVHISQGLFYGPTSGAASGGICWGAGAASLNDIRVVNQSSTIPAVGIDLTCGGTVVSLNRFVGKNLNAVNFGSQIKWPAAAIASQVDVFVAANASQNLYCTAANSCGVGIPTGLDVTLHSACNSCLDPNDPNISTITAGFAPPFAIGSFPACTAALSGQHYSANNCNSACSVGTACTAGGTTVCEMYCKGSATSWLETGLTE